MLPSGRCPDSVILQNVRIPEKCPESRCTGRLELPCPDSMMSGIRAWYPESGMLVRILSQEDSGQLLKSGQGLSGLRTHLDYGQDNCLDYGGAPVRNPDAQSPAVRIPV